MFKPTFLVSVSVILLVFLTQVSAELFTAIVEMEILVGTERQVLQVLDDYIKRDQSRLDKLRRLRTRYEQIQQAAEQDTTQFLSNPINSFQLVKSLTSDWKQGKQINQSIDICIKF